MVQIDLKYLNVYEARGRLFAYYRRGDWRRRLLNEDGTPVDPASQAALIQAWQRANEAYEAAQAAASTAAAGRTIRPKSIADLIKQYLASPDWDEKKPETKRDYEKALRPLERDYGHLPVASMKRSHVRKVRDSYAWRSEKDPADPAKTRRVRNARQANRVITVLSILMTLAIDLDWREDNPCLRPKRLKPKTEGYRAWTPAEWQQFCERAPDDWHFAGLLALLTAQRGQDQVAMRWSDYDGQRVHVVQEKGGKLVKLWVPCHPALKEALDERREAMKSRPTATLMTILARPDGRQWAENAADGRGVNAFQKAAGKAIRAAGLAGPVWHGLRTTALTWAAEGGASGKALQGLAGHRTAAMTERYTRDAERGRMAALAVEAIVLPLANGTRTGTGGKSD